MPTINVRPDCGSELQDIADMLAKSRKIVVITGAGISTNCGIPDFRSENGLYALIQAQYEAAAHKKPVGEELDRPKKRRKLERSFSTNSLPTKQPEAPATELRSRLRSSCSFPVIATVSTPPRDVEDQPAVEQPLLINDNSKASRPLSKRTQATPSDSDEPPSSQASVSLRQSLPNLKGKDLFDSMIWSDALTTSIFYTFTSSLRHKIINDVKDTTETHKFIKALRDAGRLVRNYTQNIDMLEAREGLCTKLERGTGSRIRFSQKYQRESKPGIESSELAVDSGVEVVHLHGSLDRLRCGLCARSTSWDEDDRHNITLAGEAPNCPWCVANTASREGKGRRSLAVGRLRPDIVLYGEEHPEAHLVAPLVTHDLSLGPDLVLILGTSLRVHGLKFMVREFSKAARARGGKVVFVNQTKPPESIWGEVIDYWVECDCDAWVRDLKNRKREIWSPPSSFSDPPAKEDKPKTAAKNPSAIRPDITNGAYLTMKIVDRLGRLSGRLPESPSVGVQALEKSITSEPESKKRKRQPPARPNAVRPNKENGAYLVFEIMTNLRRLIGGSIAPLLPTARQIPLSTISANISTGRRAKVKGMSKEGFDLPQLPTPPNSDLATLPLTPETRRIKNLGSISAILSSPLRVWRG